MKKGYLVAVNTCTWPKPLHYPAGTTITYTGNYHSDPYRDAVMTLFYFVVVHRPTPTPAILPVTTMRIN